MRSIPNSQIQAKVEKMESVPRSLEFRASRTRASLSVETLPLVSSVNSQYPDIELLSSLNSHSDQLNPTPSFPTPQISPPNACPEHHRLPMEASTPLKRSADEDLSLPETSNRRSAPKISKARACESLPHTVPDTVNSDQAPSVSAIRFAANSDPARQPVRNVSAAVSSVS